MGASRRHITSARTLTSVDGEQRAARRDGGPPAMTATSWSPRRALDLREWLEHGRRFGVLGRGIAWWIGDWLVYGNERYGERYARAARATGYDPQSLMNLVYVASRFRPERRRPGLSWSHHAEVAALLPVEQERWLELAERERMSVRSLRAELRTARRAAARLAAPVECPDDLANREPSASVICPHCKSVIDLAAEPVDDRAGARRAELA